MKVSISLVALALLLTVSACTKSKKLYSLAGMEATSRGASQPVDLAVYEDKYGDYDGVFLFEEEVIEHAGGKEVGFINAFFSMPSTWSFQRIARTKYIVFNPRVEWLTSFTIWIEPDSLYLRITNPGDSTREYGLADLREEKTSYGRGEYRFIFPDVRHGSIIETGYSIDFTVGGGVISPPLEHSIPLQHAIPAEKVLFTYACPEWWTYQIKWNGETGQPLVVEGSDPETRKTVLKVRRTDVPAIKTEKYAPYFKDVADYLQFQVTDLIMGGSKYTAPKSWQEFGSNIRKHGLKKLDNLTSLVQRQTQNVVDWSESPQTKIRRILQFARDSIEIDYRNRDGNPDKVLKDRKANIYDLTALVSAMLAEGGFPNDYLLVHSADEGFCDTNYISMTQFNSPAVGYRLDGEYCAIFPYIEGLPPGVTPPWLLGEPALVLDKGEIRLVHLPDTNQIPCKTSELYDLTINEDGLLNVKEERHLGGVKAFLMRRKLSGLTQREMEEAVKDMLTYTSGNVDLTSFEINELDDPYQPLEMKYEYTIDNLITITPHEALFQTAGLFSPLSGTKLIDDPTERVHGLVIRYGEEFNKKVLIRYPDSWALATPLKNIQAVNDFGMMSGQYELSAGLVSVDQKVQLNRISKPRSAYAEFLEIAGGRSNLHIPTLVFTIDQTSSPVTPKE